MYKIRKPKTDRDGLENTLKLISNQIEQGNSREALLQLTDLIDTIQSAVFRYNDTFAKVYNAAWQMYSALNALRKARKVSTQEFSHESYRNDDVRAMFAMIAAMEGEED